MTNVLLITDDLRRTKLLASEFKKYSDCCHYDLLANEPFSHLSGLIVSDIKTITSTVFDLLRNFINSVRTRGAIYVHLSHGSSGRSNAFADLLNPTSVLSASLDVSSIVKCVSSACPELKVISQAATRYSKSALEFSKTTLLSGKSPEASQIDIGSEIVLNAIQELGIREWIQVVRTFDDATHQHCLLVAGVCAAFCGVLGLKLSDRYSLVRAALLHDVGKVKIPAAILNSSEKLSIGEMSVMRTHTTLGYEMLLGCGYDANLLAVVRSHHEMLDGSGYPDQLKGHQIPDHVRIVTICDIFSALIERRPYRAPMSMSNAYDILDKMSDKLDVDLVREFHKILESNDGLLV